MLCALFLGIFVRGIALVCGILVLGMLCGVVIWRIQLDFKALNSDIKGLSADSKGLLRHTFLSLESRLLFRNLLSARLKILKSRAKSQKSARKLKLANLQNSQIISSLCHELKNPISIILGYCDLLQDSAKIPIAREKITRNAQKLDMILNRLILAAKLEANLVSVEASAFSLKAMIIEIVAQLGEKYPQKRVITRMRECVINADKMLIECAIGNLIENALKYSRQSVKITLKSGVLSVVDDGEGFSKDEKTKILKKFYRAKTTYPTHSLGLGLFITNYVLKLHKMDLKIKSKLGKGSNFSVKIPRNLVVQ